MLSTIPIPVRELFDKHFNPATGKDDMIGQSYVYNGLDIIDKCVSNGKNIDEFLTRRLVSKLASKKPKRKVLILYAFKGHGLLALIACSKNQNLPCSWLTKLPSFVEMGQDFIPRNSRFFIYWDGSDAYRVYDKPKNYEHGQYLACNFFPTLRVTPMSAERYEEIERDKLSNLEYSAVPEDEEQLLEFRGNRFLLRHTFYKFA